jgi:hypothetical protein
VPFSTPKTTTASTDPISSDLPHHLAYPSPSRVLALPPPQQHIVHWIDSKGSFSDLVMTLRKTLCQLLSYVNRL